MNTKKHNSLDDLVFEHKNKAYGAYHNRITAGFDLMKSLFITIFGLGILAIVLSFTIKDNENTIIDEEGVIVTIDPNVGKIPPSEKEKPVEKEKSTPKIKIVADKKTDISPTPTKNPDSQTEMRDHDDLSTAVSGDIDSPGDAHTGIKSPDHGTGTTDGNDSGTTEVAQPEKTIYFVRDVAHMAVFPGCEKFAGNNEKLQKCLSDQLHNELSGQLSDFEVIANRQGIDQAVAKIQFIIDKSGKIVEIKTLNGGNQELSKESRDALERISKRMIQKGKFIQPAKFKDGTPVNLIFTIPVKFVSN